MKRLPLIALVLMLALPAAAREERGKSQPSQYKHEINVSWGMIPGNESSGYSSYVTNYEAGLDKIYNNYMGPCTTSGLISADYNIQFRRHFALGIQMNGSVRTSTEISSIKEEVAAKYSMFNISALVYARFTYINRPMFKMYTSFGLGVRYTSKGRPDEIRITNPFPGASAAYQFVPYGFMIGNRIYGLAEMGIGGEFNGVRVGIGYRF